MYNLIHGRENSKGSKCYRKDSKMDRQLLKATLEKAEKNLQQQARVFEFAEFCNRHGIKHNTMQEYQAALRQYFLTEINK